MKGVLQQHLAGNVGGGGKKQKGTSAGTPLRLPQSLVEEAFRDLWRRCQPGYEDALRDAMALHGFDPEDGAKAVFADVYPPVGKTQDELKAACMSVGRPGEAGLMATHVELQSINRANFIGAAPTLSYSSIGALFPSSFFLRVCNLRVCSILHLGSKPA